MRKYLFLFSTILLVFTARTQDTTWVQTFTFDSITTRRANFEFPQELNSKRFEKVLMYYKLKCSPLTTWDQYNCGEWDYLTYTRVIEHTGIFDSVIVNGNKYQANFQSPASVVYVPQPYTFSDTYVRNEKNRSASAATTQVVTGSNGTTPFPFDVSKNGGRFQMLLTANELNAAGVSAGNMESLTLYLNAIAVNGELKYPTISLKATAENALTNFHKTGFTEVYNAAHWSGGSQAELTTGSNELLFYQPFNWNGTSNIIVEFYFENSEDALNALTFEGGPATSSSAMYYNSRNGCIEFDGTNQSMLELSDFDLGSEMTITFWAKGTGSSGVNTSVLEAYDKVGNRIINIHFPWSDNTMYFDAGIGSGYDRISKPMSAAEIDNNWNHWAFVKKQSTGQMLIYKNGALWHSGTNKNLPLGEIHRFMLGANKSLAFRWRGKLDDFQLYDVALPQATIQSWMTKKPDNSHPNWSDLLVFYDFDNQSLAEDLSANDYKLMPSQLGMFKFNEYPNTGIQVADMRPKIGIGQGTVSGALVTTPEIEKRLKEPTVIFELQPAAYHFKIVGATVGLLQGNETVYSGSNQVLSQTPFSGTDSLINAPIVHYQTPVEQVNDIEIARYITPYGIQFDLGPNGFYWIYDVTDYQHYLKNTVDLAAHNTQELLDLRFAFIEGIPPRDVHKREPIWSEYRSYQYSAMDNNTVLQEVPKVLSDSSEMFKIKTRFTGHGHNGTTSCCEWDSKDHTISLDGIPRFTWEIWEEDACGENPNISQGGTWPYAREGWCPGDMVREYDHELTPFVSGGDTVLIDYDIEDIPANDMAQGSGNYIVAMDLISYSAPNFQNDAAVVDILNPNNWEYYRKWNPSCSNPRVVLQNTGAQPLTSCKIRCWISYGDWLEFDWTGNLAFLEKEIVEIPVTDLAWWRDYEGTQTFHAQVYAVGGYPDLDEYANNNVMRTKFDATESINGPFFVWFTTNNKAHENKYRLEDASGTVLFERTNLANTTQYRDTFNLEPGCYSLILEDSDDDGIGFWYSSQVEGETSGSFRVRLVGGNFVEIFPADFGSYHRYNFSVGYGLGLNPLEMNDAVKIFPNPTSGICTIELNGVVDNSADLQIFDLMGRNVHHQVMNASADFAVADLDLTTLPKGTYIVKIVTNQHVFTKEFVKQ